MAKKSLEQAEFLFKSMPAMSKEQIQLNSKMFIENKRLAAENGRVKKEMQDLRDLLEQEREDSQYQQARSHQKLQRLTSHANELKRST